MAETLTAPNQLINEQGYAPMPIATTSEELSAAIDAYMAFLELPEKYQEATRYELTNRGDGDFGQYRREANTQSSRGLRADNKDFFHFGAMTRQIVEERLVGDLPRELRTFLNSLENIYWDVQATKQIALQSFDIAGNGLLRALQPERSRINDLLRILAYYPSEGGLAKGHFDRSVATLAIGESHPGLRIAPGQNGLRVNADAPYMADLESRLADVDHKPGEAKFFLGAGWNRMPAGLREGLEPTSLAFHDVINNGQQVGERVMRWAAVMFINPHADFEGYQIPSQPETRPYKQLGRLAELRSKC